MGRQIPNRTRSELTRNAILKAAVVEFGEKGVSGARTEAIATAAGVNKALLHYYFKDKAGLYKAVLQHIFAGVSKQEFAVLTGAGSEGERLLRWALQHFDDRVIVHRDFQKLIQQELIRAREGSSDVISFLVRSFFRPLFRKAVALVRSGIQSGELCAVDPIQVTYSILGPNVFYFMSAPIMQLVLSLDPLAPVALRRRRKATLSFLSQALFSDRAHGRAIAEQILSDTPMPKWVVKPHSRRKTS
jgi:TetR/AcrR family transcriptional regulator